MDNLVFYQLTNEDATAILKEIDVFNKGRTDANGKYCISLATQYRPYYVLWRMFPDETLIPVRTLAVTFESSVERAITLLANCNVRLEVANNSYFESYYGRSEGIIPFGKYNGKKLAEILYIDPSYILWLANKFVSDNPRYERLTILAKHFACVHFELNNQKHHNASSSEFVGEKGARISDSYLTVLNVRVQVDSYKPDYYVDQNVLAIDGKGNRFTFLIKAAGKSMTPKQLSCHTRIVNKQEVLHILSAKVMRHYEFNGIKYTRLGYVKLV